MIHRYKILWEVYGVDPSTIQFTGYDTLPHAANPQWVETEVKAWSADDAVKQWTFWLQRMRNDNPLLESGGIFGVNPVENG